MSLQFKLITFIFASLLSQIACLSLDDIHSSPRRFKTVRNRDHFDSASDVAKHNRREYVYAFQPHSLPSYSQNYYKTFIPHVKKQDEEIIDVPLEYDQFESNFDDEPSDDLISTALAIKLSKILSDNDRLEPNNRILKGINMKRKRSAVKLNNKSNSRYKALNKTNDRNPIKVKTLRAKPNAAKSKTKRKSTRRVLNDHFKIEQNVAVIDDGKKANHNTRKANSIATKSSKDSPKRAIQLSPKQLSTKTKKLITKRKVSQNDDTINNTNSVNSRQTKVTDKNVINELNAILSDDTTENKQLINSDTQRKAKSVANKSKSESNANVRTIVKKMTKRSNLNEDDNIEIESDIKDDDDQQNEDKEMSIDDKENFDEWLRREYYDNIAKAMATMRRKRSDNYVDSEDDDEDSISSDTIDDTLDGNLISIEDDNVNTNTDNNENNLDGKKNEEIYEDESDDDYVIATEDDDDTANNDISDLPWNEEGDKTQSTKTKRSVSPYIDESGSQIETKDVSNEAVRFNHVDNKLQLIEDALISEALEYIQESARKDSQNEADKYKIENRLDAAYDVEDMRASLNNLHNTMEKIKEEYPEEEGQEDIIDKTSNEIVIPVIKVINAVKSKDNLESDCAALEAYTSGCAPINDLIPNGKMKDLITEACSWHDICYNCGEAYGLLSSDCDAAFLEASRLACNGHPSCEAFARLILVPLRQTRVFYKSQVPSICNRSQCVKHLLTDDDSKR